MAPPIPLPNGELPNGELPKDAADMGAEAGVTAGDGGLLELPLQERHHRIISAFMAAHQPGPSPSGFEKGGRVPGAGVLRKLAGWLRTWRA